MFGLASSHPHVRQDGTGTLGEEACSSVAASAWHGTGSLFLNGKKGRNERCWTPVSGTFNVHYSTLYATLVGVHYIPSRKRANVGKRRCTHLLHLQEPVKHRPVLARGYPRQSDFRLFFGHLENVTLSRAAQSDLSATVSSQKGEEESTA